MSRYVAIATPEGTNVHLPDTTGNYATLCGMDGADEHEAVQQTRCVVQPGRKVDCRHCKAIWELARTYRASDFSI